MLQVASVLSGCCICCSGYTRILQVYVPNVSTVASVLSKYCICCSGYTHMLQAYVSNVSLVSDVFCSKYFMLQVFSLAGEESKRRRRRSPRASVFINMGA
jgi:hypothetical protein